MTARQRGGTAWFRHRMITPFAIGWLALGTVALAGCVGPGLASRYRALDKEWRYTTAIAQALESDDPFSGAPRLDREAFVREVVRRKNRHRFS